MFVVEVATLDVDLLQTKHPEIELWSYIQEFNDLELYTSMFSRNPTKHSVYQLCTHFSSHLKPKWAQPICDPNKRIVCRRLWTKCFSDQINGSYVCAMEVRKQMKSPMIVLCTKVEPLPFGRKDLQQMSPPPLWCQRGEPTRPSTISLPLLLIMWSIKCAVQNYEIP